LRPANRIRESRNPEGGAFPGTTPGYPRLEAQKNGEAVMEGNARIARASIRILAIVVVAVFSLIALVPSAHAGPKGTDRPIEGACDNDITPLSPPGVFPVLLAVETTCHISHLGLTVGFTDSEVIVPAGPPVGTVLPVSITVTKIVYVGANGDQLWSTFGGGGEIDFATGRATFDGTETYIGGTGRFSNATGQSHTFGEGSLFTNKATLTTAGTISY
jgi:hypothetical protein